MSKVVFLGPEGTFTHQACLQHLKEATLIPELAIEQIFYSVESGKADMGVVPIENSTEGVVTHALDCLMSSELKIQQEIELVVRHCLYTTGQEGKNIHKIYSHPQAFAQCKRYLKQHFPNVEYINTSSTAKALERMLKDPLSGAIAGPHAMDYYPLNIHHEDIQDNSVNTTRFLVIGHEASNPTSHDKTSLVLALDDKPGTLVNLLSPFSLLDINLTKIESRPVPEKKWKNNFFVDLLGHIQDEKVRMALAVLETIGVRVKHLGSYPCYQGEKS